MCFFAPASFLAGTALTAVGVATLRLASRPSHLQFAAIPLLFGLQQLIEGLIWLSFRDASQWPNPPLTFIYSLFSHVLWPIYVPFAVRLLETVPWRRNALAVLQIAGIAVGLYLLYFLVQFPITSRVAGNHIVYESHKPARRRAGVLGLLAIPNPVDNFVAQPMAEGTQGLRRCFNLAPLTIAQRGPARTGSILRPRPGSPQNSGGCHPQPCRRSSSFLDASA